MKHRRFALAVIGLAAALAPIAGGAQAAAYYLDRYGHRHYYHHRYYGYRRTCGAARRSNGTAGTIVGGVGGAAIGAGLTHGSAVGTLLGAGAGAVAGHAVGRSSTHC